MKKKCITRQGEEWRGCTSLPNTEKTQLPFLGGNVFRFPVNLEPRQQWQLCLHEAKSDHLESLKHMDRFFPPVLLEIDPDPCRDTSSATINRRKRRGKDYFFSQNEYSLFR